MSNLMDDKRRLDDLAKKQHMEQISRDRKMLDDQIRNREQELKALRTQITEHNRILDTLVSQVKMNEQDENRLKGDLLKKEAEIVSLKRQRDSIR